MKVYMLRSVQCKCKWQKSAKGQGFSDSKPSLFLMKWISFNYLLLLKDIILMRLFLLI